MIHNSEVRDREGPLLLLLTIAMHVNEANRAQRIEYVNEIACYMTCYERSEMETELIRIHKRLHKLILNY